MTQNDTALSAQQDERAWHGMLQSCGSGLLCPAHRAAEVAVAALGGGGRVSGAGLGAGAGRCVGGAEGHVVTGQVAAAAAATGLQ